MRGRVTSLLILLLSLSSSAFPQCSWTPRSSSAFRSTVLDVAAEESYLWTANGYGVQLLLSGRSTPELIDTLALPGQTRVVRARTPLLGGNPVYAGSGSRLYVLRRGGNAIQLIRSVDAGGTINDIVAGPAHLYVATSNGIAQFDLADATNPVRTTAKLETSVLNVLSLAIADGVLYAADGDSSVETFTIATPTLPQRTGSLASLPRSLAVHADASGGPLRIFVSDGQSTDVFVNGARVARVATGATSFTANGAIAYVAGSDRSVRAMTFGDGTTSARLYEHQLAPTGGTVNRIGALERIGDRLYAAAGDIGLITYDIAPFANANVRVFAGAATSSSFAGSSLYAAREAGGISELTTFERRKWGGDTRYVIHDEAANRLLTSHGNRLTWWDLAPATPTAAWTATFATTIKAAVIAGNDVHALLDDGSVWSANVTTDATPQQVTTGQADLARHGNALALVQLDATGNSVIRYFADGNLRGTPRTFTVPGASTARIALDATRVAVFTFAGITVVNLGSGAATVLPSSNNAIVEQLAFADPDWTLALTDRAVLAWRGNVFSHESPVAGETTSMEVSGSSLAVSTSEGVLVSGIGPGNFPRVLAAANPNRYYTRLAAGNDRLYLFSADGIDVFSTATGFTPAYVSSVRAAGAIDLAASDVFLFTLAANGTASTYSRDGNLVAQVVLSEGADSQPLSIFTAGGAPWVSFSKGCLSGACEKKTLVLDPRSLATTATLTGGVVDVVTSDTRAYALMSLPNELRVFTVTDRQRPSPIVSRAAEGDSVAYAGGTVYVLADKLLAFDEGTLAPKADALPAATADASQRVRIDGNCAVVIGRAANPELFALPQWSAAPSVELPSATRVIATAPGRLFILTETSLEVWANTPAASPGKRRGVR